MKERERWNDFLNEIPVNACAIARFGFYKLHVVLGCERCIECVEAAVDKQNGQQL